MNERFKQQSAMILAWMNGPFEQQSAMIQSWMKGIGHDKERS